MTETVTTPLSMRRILLLGIAMVTAGAGVIHLDAASDHGDHAVVAMFFVAAGLAQLVLAALLCPATVQPRVVAAALAVNAGMVLTWLVSRTLGMASLPLVGGVPGMEGREPVGIKDMAATSLEGTGLLLGLLAATLPAAAAAAPLAATAARRSLAGLVAMTLAVTVPGLMAAHGHGDHHGAGEHSQQEAGDHGHEGDDHAGDGHLDAEQVHSKVSHEEHGGNEGQDRHDGEHTDGGHTDAGHTDGGHSGTHDDGQGDGHPGTHTDGTHTDGTHDGHTGTPTGHHSSIPAEQDPLAGPGRISTLRVGPFTILPSFGALDPPHTTPLLPMIAPGKLNILPMTGIKAPCPDCYVLGMQPDLVYADGSDANLDTGPMLHHIVLTDPSRPDPVCGNRSIVGLLGERFFASGNERTGITLPTGYGMPFEGNTLNGAVELMNMSSKLKTVYFELKVRWVPKAGSDIKPVRTVWMDIDSCGDSEVDIDAGVSDIKWGWDSTLTGRFVGAGGHLHDGGTWLAMHNRTRREHICTSVAGYGNDPAYMGSLDHMSFCTWDRLGSVRKGDRLTLNAHYNTDIAQRGVMGIMLAFLHETPDVDGGTISPYPSAPPPDSGPIGGHQH